MTIPKTYLPYFSVIRIVAYQAVKYFVLVKHQDRIYLTHQFLKKKLISIIIDSCIDHIRVLNEFDLQ